MRQFGELEAVIMNRLWAWGRPALVREMVDDLQKDRQIAYTTVMTVMDNLYRKGWLRRHRDGRAWRYEPTGSRSGYTATLSFRTAGYQSTRLTLRTTELTDNAGHPLQALSALDRQVIGRYDVPPYVNSADQSGAVPFLDIGNRYVLAGAQYDPQVLAGLSAAQIAAQLRNPSSPVAQAIDGSAKVIVAAINQVLHDQVSGG